MFNDFKPVLKILLRFVAIYVLLVLGYQFYLNFYENSGLDPVSVWVADQTVFVQNSLNYPSQMVPGTPQLNWLMVMAAVLGLVGVRALEDRIFYDPFLNFFRSADRLENFPEFRWFALVIHHVFRFGLNLITSLIVVQAIFKNKKWTVQAAVLMLLVFLVTLPIYLYCIHTKFEIGYLFSFYMRRFVIQPLILLLIIPLFYYRKKLMRA